MQGYEPERFIAGELIQHDSSLHLWSPWAKEKWWLITSLDDFSPSTSSGLRLCTSSCPSVPRSQGRGKAQCRGKAQARRGGEDIRLSGSTVLSGSPSKDSVEAHVEPPLYSLRHACIKRYLIGAHTRFPDGIFAVRTTYDRICGLRFHIPFYSRQG
jgi:hypothetical protein